MPARSVPSAPASIGEYDVVSTLSQTGFRAMASDGRSVILKTIPPDCTVEGNLHPDVHTRLSRVRELAHPGVANLRSVEREAGRIVAVWDDIRGQSIDLYVSEKVDSPAGRRRLARELLTAVESLHRLGVVHGAIHVNNVMIDSTGVLRLTHVSPYLHEDVTVDSAGVANVLRAIANVAEPADTALTYAAAGSSLQSIAARLGGAGGAVTGDPDEHAQSVRSSRMQSWVAAAVVAAVGLLLTFGIWLLTH